MFEKIIIPAITIVYIFGVIWFIYSIFEFLYKGIKVFDIIIQKEKNREMIRNKK